MKNLELAMGAAIKAHVGRAKNRHQSGESGTRNPILHHKLRPTRGNAIKAKCAECMGCTEIHLERGFRAALEDYVGCNRSTIYRWQKIRGFPQPFLKSATSSTYDLAVVEAWVEAQRDHAK